jgi:small subunit ribosomal protein S4
VTKRIASKYKISRRLGLSLWGRPKDPVNKKNYGPGQHGAAGRRKTSDFGLQLKEKQKLKGYYGNIGEKQFRAIYEEAVRMRGDTSQNLIGILESRLDAVIYRLNFAITVFASRQLINHGHVLVNGSRVNIPSYRVKEGDVIEIKEKSKQNVHIMSAAETREREVPEYVESDSKALKGKFLRIPKFEEVPYPVLVEPNLVVEYYSR